MDLSIVILAGGEGSRLGGAKPLCRLAGMTLIEWAIGRARSWSADVAIAVRDPAQVGDTGLPVLVDPFGFQGPLGGLASALQFGQGVVLTIPCDMPFLPIDLPDRLAAALPGHEAALAASGGRVHPVCGLWRTRAIHDLGRYAATGQMSLIGLAERIGHVAVEWPGDPFFNVNSPEDLALAEARIA
jgi:molybdopterin-guanine dinucleotide biosynthesis protein A